MNKRPASVLTGAAAGFLICALARSASGEMRFDTQHYKDLVDASSSQTIPPGTKITLQNWKQYKNFMPLWLQAAYSGDYHSHIGSVPEFTITVWPTSKFPPPHKYLDATGKYHNHVSLEKTSCG